MTNVLTLQYCQCCVVFIINALGVIGCGIVMHNENGFRRQQYVLHYCVQYVFVCVCVCMCVCVCVSVFVHTCVCLCV